MTLPSRKLTSNGGKVSPLCRIATRIGKILRPFSVSTYSLVSLPSEAGTISRIPPMAGFCNRTLGIFATAIL
ncbi:hypothetical protein BES34_017695 [Leptospira inadai serovar Lyme]|uniref:Lipoprotein n=1 Tax=Leptospira inadai serovar Lyme TaxID=293084 RepID=A0ABX4YET9_9LEPT|nr:hypothetical protein BES34_017695 [Leptospira inadai serovar Lyme]